jgi:hypothetical protein
MSYLNCTTTTIQPVECTHPFDYLFKIMDDIYNSDGNTLSKFDILTELLQNGLVVPNCNMCCPNCGDTYLLMGVECFLSLTESSEFQLSDVGECCLNVRASREIYEKYYEALSDPQNKIPATSCCNTEFNDCIINFEEWFGDKYLEDYSYFPNQSPAGAIRDALLDLGIVELSTIGSNEISGICKLVELFDEYNLTDGLTAEQFINSFIQLFFACNNGDGGIIVKCYSNGSVYIGQAKRLNSYESF